MQMSSLGALISQPLYLVCKWGCVPLREAGSGRGRGALPLLCDAGPAWASPLQLRPGGRAPGGTRLPVSRAQRPPSRPVRASARLGPVTVQSRGLGLSVPPAEFPLRCVHNYKMETQSLQIAFGGPGEPPNTGVSVHSPEWVITLEHSSPGGLRGSWVWTGQGCEPMRGGRHFNGGN